MSLVKDAFEQQARIVRKGFKQGREKTVGASEIGQCARKIGYVKHHAEPDNDFINTWGATKRGSIFETRFFLPAMRKKYGDKLLYAGKQQRRLVSKQLSATPDGLLVHQPRNLLAGLMVPDIGPDRSVVIECKTVDPRINLSEAKPEHVFQVIVQLGMIRLLTRHKPLYGVIVYTNASFYDDTIEFPIEYDHEAFTHAQERAAKIMTATTVSELKPEGWIAGGDECHYCPFARSCRSLRGDVPANDLVAKDPQFIAEMTDLAQQERELATTLEDIKTAQREIQEGIKTRLREKRLRIVKDSGITIIWSAVKGRPSYDMVKIKAAAAAAGVDIQQFETVGDLSDRLTVSVTSRDRLVKSKQDITHGKRSRSS